MKLMLHVGTEKTGSSYIQSALALNRLDLVQKGIYFPRSIKWEKEMIKGNISAGNGERMQKSLISGDEKTLCTILLNLINKARRLRLDTILISNEMLYKSFNANISSNRFIDLCKSCGFEDIKFFLFIREPVEQALSLYKHRAKTGRNENFFNWLNTGYRLPHDLSLFIEQKPLNLTIRKYEISSQVIFSRFFMDWLNMDNGFIKNPVTNVNVSLTLSELKLISIVKRVRPQVMNRLYKNLLNLPRERKALDAIVEGYYKFKIAEHLKESTDVWREVNELLLKDEQLQSLEQDYIERGSVEWVFSDSQLERISGAIAGNTILQDTLMYYFKKIIVSPLSKIKWSLYRLFNLHY